MSYISYDPLEWETVVDRRTCTSCNGDSSKCRGGCNGMLSIGTRRRPQADIDRLKTEQQRKNEDLILAQADAIRARRGMS